MSFIYFLVQFSSSFFKYLALKFVDRDQGWINVGVYDPKCFSD